MNEHTQQISATTSQRAQQLTQQISATSDLDLPQFGSEDDDETWLIELIGGEVKGPYEAAKQAYIDHWEGYWELASLFHQNPKNQPGAEPDLPRITVPIVTPISTAPCSINGRERDLPGPRSQDDDEDSPPFVQYLDSADHVPCSSSTMTTLGHNNIDALAGCQCPRRRDC